MRRLVASHMWHVADSLQLKTVQGSVDAVGDVPVTYADTSALERDLGYRPQTKLEDGLREFARWYRGYRGPQ